MVDTPPLSAALHAAPVRPRGTPVARPQPQPWPWLCCNLVVPLSLRFIISLVGFVIFSSGVCPHLLFIFWRHGSFWPCLSHLAHGHLTIWFMPLSSSTIVDVHLFLSSSVYIAYSSNEKFLYSLGHLGLSALHLLHQFYIRIMFSRHNTKSEYLVLRLSWYTMMAATPVTKGTFTRSFPE